jgi:hypothetical protein
MLELAMDTEQRQLPEWVKRAHEHAGMTQADLSRVLVQAGLTWVDRAAVSKVIKGERVLKAEEMLEISRITGYPIPDRRIGAKPMVVDEHPKVADERPIERPCNGDIGRATPGSPELETRLAVAEALLEEVREDRDAWRAQAQRLARSPR